MYVIVAAMATMPERMPYLENAVRALRPQVDALRVYLNNFVEVPDFLTADEGILSGDAEGDLGDRGKFYWFDGEAGLEHTHYLPVDDDIGYPANYVAAMVAEFDVRDRQAIVGVHGSTFLQPIDDFVTSRDERFRFYEGLRNPRSVHILGTATMVLSRDTIDLRPSDFKMHNAADLQLAIAAQKQGVPMVAIPRGADWLTEDRPWTTAGFSIWKATKEQDHSAHTDLARTVSSWNLIPDPLETKAASIAAANRAKPLFAESVPPGGFDECIKELNEKLSGDVFFVVVGAMDGIGHDRLHKHIDGNKNWKGLFVEPLPDMFQKLKANYAGRDNFLFEEAAITQQEGTAAITRIPEANVDNECPSWADGISTLRPDIHIIGQHDNLKKYSVQQQVRTTTFATIARKHALRNIDVLQIDAEGYDKVIFDQIWQGNFRPNVIKIEVNYLTYVNIKELIQQLATYDYGYFFENDDLVAFRR